MQRCFQLAQNGLGNVAPNPLVGAVIVHEGLIIGEGYHAVYGGPHAEVMAIRNCRRPELLPQSTLYVNLEPCSHFGKTPPCADLIIEQRIPRVVICNVDPFPQVAGRGIQKLREAGVNVTAGLSETEGEWLNRRFFTFHRQKRPFVILKWARSADGFMDGTDEHPAKISDPLTDQLVHRWRTEEAGIFVGYRTALKDNPRLTARLYPGSNPIRIVWDPKLELPKHLHLFSDGGTTWIFNNEKETEEGALHYFKIEHGNWAGLLNRLYERKLMSLIVEGGANSLHSLIEHGLWDEARIITGSGFLGEGLKAPELSQARLRESRASGTDTIHFFERQHISIPS